VLGIPKNLFVIILSPLGTGRPQNGAGRHICFLRIAVAAAPFAGYSVYSPAKTGYC
jgi:hypothetical protein